MTRRICLYAGPCAGKTTLATWLFSELTIADYRIQYIEEYVKLWACENRIPDTWDQPYILMKQLKKEKDFLKSGKVDLIVTDSPCLMVGAYCERNNMPIAPEVINIAKKFDAEYPALHLFLDRAGIPYRTDGRYETYAKALATDEVIESVMKKHLDSYMKVRTKDRVEVLNIILKHLRQDEQWSALDSPQA